MPRAFCNLLARVFTLGLVAWSYAAVGHAQLHRATDPVMTPASSVVLADDAVVIDVNPGALGHLEGPSFAYIHSEVDQSGSWLGRGDALYLATPVIGPLALGATVQSIRPGDNAAAPVFGSPEDRAMAALGIALAPTDAVSLGLTTRVFASGDPFFDGLSGIDIGLSLRPGPALSVSLIGRDLFVTREGFGTPGLDLGSSIVTGIGLRPLGTRAVTFDFALAFDTDDSDRIGGRGGLSLPQS
jgi:hypothetical protein